MKPIKDGRTIYYPVQYLRACVSRSRAKYGAKQKVLDFYERVPSCFFKFDCCSRSSCCSPSCCSTPACAPSPVSMLPYAAEDDNSETSSLRRQSRFACNLFIQRLQRRYACNACTGVNAGLTTNSRIRVWGFATPDPRAFAPHSPLAKRNRFCEKGNALARECVQRSACNSSIGCN